MMRYEGGNSIITNDWMISVDWRRLVFRLSYLSGSCTVRSHDWERRVQPFFDGLKTLPTGDRTKTEFSTRRSKTHQKKGVNLASPTEPDKIRREFGASRPIFHNRLVSGTYCMVEEGEKAGKALPAVQTMAIRIGPGPACLLVKHAKAAQAWRPCRSSNEFPRKISWGRLPTCQKHVDEGSLATCPTLRSLTIRNRPWRCEPGAYGKRPTVDFPPRIGPGPFMNCPRECGTGS